MIMKIFRLFLLVGLLFSFSFIKSQDLNNSIKYKYVIKTCLTDYSLLIGEINLTLEKVTTNKYNFDYTLSWKYFDTYYSGVTGLTTPLSAFVQSTADHSMIVIYPSKGFGISISAIKYKDASRPKPLGKYIKYQFYNKFTYCNSTINDDNEYRTSFDRFHISKYHIGARILWGYQTKIAGNLLVDFYFGFGLRAMFQKYVTNYTYEVFKDSGETYDDDSKRTNSATIITPTINAGIAIGFGFN